MSKYLPSDQLLSYQPLFIKDVTTADIQSEQPLTLKTKHNVLLQKVKINGVIVSRQDNHGNKMDDATRCILFLDDSSAIIPVHLSQRMCNRKDSAHLTEATSVTILGEPQLHNNSIIIVCKGFHIESDPAAELYHRLQVISNHHCRGSAKNHISAAGSSCYVSSSGKKRQKLSESNLFNTLSSQPSPIRGSIEDLYSSPIRNNSRSDLGPVINNSQSSKDAPWHWSPDHIAATSTPIRHYMMSSPKYARSPLRLSQKSSLQQQEQQEPTINNNNNNNKNDDDDDDFGFDSDFDDLDFDDIEKQALEAQAIAMKLELPTMDAILLLALLSEWSFFFDELGNMLHVWILAGSRRAQMILAMVIPVTLVYSCCKLNCHISIPTQTDLYCHLAFHEFYYRATHHPTNDTKHTVTQHLSTPPINSNFSSNWNQYN